MKKQFLGCTMQLIFKRFHLLLCCSISSLVVACANNPPAPVKSSPVASQSNSDTNYSPAQNPNTSNSQRFFNGYICEGAPVFRGKSIGDGECVDLIKLCSNAPLTKYWKPGNLAFGADIPEGTAIATFRKGKYPNKSGYHAAIYSHQDANGIYAWDQWQGQTVHLRYIRARQSHKDAGNDASRYRIIRR